MAVRGIYGKPWVSMDHLIDIPSLQALHDDIIYGIAASPRTYGVLGVMRDTKKYGNMHLAQEGMKKAETGHPYHSLETDDDRRTYLKLKEGVYIGHKSVSILAPVDFAQKHNASLSRYKPCAENFHSLLQWIEKQDLFASMGRIHVFVTEHDCVIAEHRDEIRPQAHDHEMIWFRTRLDKSLYILDPKTNERHYIDSYSAFFNDIDFHGGDPSPKMTFTIRVDGYFNLATRAKLGLPEKPVY